ncbi:AarF/ABC1/UbiB kinase family protein [Streptomyces sp. HPF1205]|uniref:ABC1 kinase family protein n=1 Tax=Streptomyces sp. HPF1205 TaxID=2873262 RepID=UPI001CEC12F0|nr:AarF/UbiB family protein [Streptomyces sp. HPF1205]
MTATRHLESPTFVPVAPVRLRHRAGRLLSVARTVARHTAGAAVDALPGVRRRAAGPAEPRWSRLVSDLGPTYVKGAQLLSTRKDLLPERWCRALGRLHDRVAPMTDRQLDLALALAYPSSRPFPFAAFDREPAASGSIACVYRATLHDGSAVAVKLRRPGIEALMRADFALLRTGARWVQRVPAMRKVPAARVVDQLGAALLRQLDLALEADALARLRTNLADLDFVRIPDPLPAVSGEGALAMEFLEPLVRFVPGDFRREPRRQIVRNVLQCVYRMLFIDGLVHCDMHPGNLYLDRDGSVVLLDAGFVVQLEPKVRLLFARFFMNLSLGRAAECAEVVLSSAEHVPLDCDLAGFRADIERLVDESTGKTAGQFRLAPFAARLFDIQRRSGVAAAPEFVFPLMSLLVLEGMINDFDVDVDFQGEAIPTLLVALNRY